MVTTFPESVYFKLIESASPFGVNSDKLERCTSLKLLSQDTINSKIIEKIKKEIAVFILNFIFNRLDKTEVEDSMTFGTLDLDEYTYTISIADALT